MTDELHGQSQKAPQSAPAGGQDTPQQEGPAQAHTPEPAVRRDLYREAGVDIDAGNEAAKRYAGVAKRTMRPEVVSSIGGFSGGFRLDVAKYPEPLLVSGTDGVGTKLRIALAAGRHDTIGIDCVAMCVNDILTCGAEPLFFLDYLAVNALDVGQAEAIVDGVAAGCEEAGCSLIGGETAEMGDMYGEGEYDLAGTAVGVVNASEVIDGSNVVDGDVILGLASNGVHSNGFSLVRKLLAEHGVALTDDLPHSGLGSDATTPRVSGASGYGDDGKSGTFADELLRPTRIYVKQVQALLAAGVDIRAMAHITGGGLPENLPRSLPDGIAAEIRVGSWPVTPVFRWLLEASGLAFADAARIWNMGIGYTVTVPAGDVERALDVLQSVGQSAYVIGSARSQAASGRDAGAAGEPGAGEANGSGLHSGSRVWFVEEAHR